MGVLVIVGKKDEDEEKKLVHFLLPYGWLSQNMTIMMTFVAAAVVHTIA